MIPDVFLSDLWSFTQLTATINNIKFKPGRLGELGLYDEQGISTLDVFVEQNSGLLELFEIRARNSPPQVLTPEKVKGQPFRVAHIPVQSTIMADEVQGVRAFGSEDQTLTIEMVRARHAERMRRGFEYTLESHRVANIKGTFYDVNGDAKSLFTTFNVSQTTVAMALTTATTKVRQKILAIIEAVEAALDGVPYTSIRVFCGKNFWAELIEHDAVKETYLGTQMASDLRKDPLQAFEFGGFTFERYRGTSLVKIPDDEAYVVPMGVEGLFITRFGPANYIETVNTIGLPVYSKSEPLPFGKGLHLEGQSNPINLVTRPGAIIKLTKV